MNTKILTLFLLVTLLIPASARGQWGVFERHYKYKLKDVLTADKFIQKKGYWEGYRKTDLVGYVFLSKDWTKNLVGYSGKHLETLIGMDPNGTITGVKIIFHSEPIVLIGLKESKYYEFINQYPGKNIKQDLAIGKGISIDAISGATVTAVVHNAIILRSARKVASASGMVKTAATAIGPKKLNKKFYSFTWNELVESGAVQRTVITFEELGLEGEGDYLELFFGVVDVPSIGRNILGDKLYREKMKNLKKDESVIFLFSRGQASFKGSGFARGGTFDRFNLEQGDLLNVFRESDYTFLTKVRAKGAPKMREGGLFIIRSDEFDSSRPFKLNLIIPYRVGGQKKFRSFSEEYKLPARFFE